jgi:predicted CXXCH cytochrome family protein
MLDRIALLFLTFLLSSMVTTACAEQGMAIDPATCLGCHRDHISAREFAASVHGVNACTSCHVEIIDLPKHMKGETRVAKVQCERCHKKVAAEHLGSIHAQRNVRCAVCHTEIHSATSWKKDKRVVVAKCVRCHDKHELYSRSVHGKGVAAGNQDSAACHDCHELHATKALNSLSLGEARRFHTLVCMKCHSDENMMQRNHVFNVSVKTYMASYHGKNFRLGFPERVAGCSDCHTAHAVLPKSDPQSSLHPANLQKTCGACHKHSNAKFVAYLPHAEYDRDKYPVLYWTFVGMTGLLVSVFAVFWLHTLLWMFRGFVENREKEALLAEGRALHEIPDGHRHYVRFKPIHIFLHLLVITSFLGLSLTGLPLKFSDQDWARFLISHLGGTSVAGHVHRACAVVTFIYFFAAMLMSVHFLFLRNDIKGNFLQRLFGPDSLCPNFRDLRDVKGMVRWFFFRGPKPSFERWTYWEKFDFLAVFWGMFAIGGSGLLLWNPEFFAQYLPGWAFNVATIIHSDEALLATGFIFTVHFFNTHGRPEKFPMDFVIFNGQITKYELIEERGDLWARYERDGITEQFKAARLSGVLYEFLLKGFGFVAVLTGLTLLGLMVFAFMHSSGH